MQPSEVQTATCGSLFCYLGRFEIILFNFNLTKVVIVLVSVKKIFPHAVHTNNVFHSAINCQICNVLFSFIFSIKGPNTCHQIYSSFRSFEDTTSCDSIWYALFFIEIQLRQFLYFWQLLLFAAECVKNVISE